jgi:hypothetical protein
MQALNANEVDKLREVVSRLYGEDFWATSPSAAAKGSDDDVAMGKVIGIDLGTTNN